MTPTETPSPLRRAWPVALLTVAGFLAFLWAAGNLPSH